MDEHKIKELIMNVEDFLINEFGMYFERMGAKTLLGRIYGYLITKSDPVSLKDISDKLAISKPAISTALNSVYELGLFKKIYMPEFPRESFYKVGTDSMELMIDPGLKKLQLLIDRFDSSLNMINKHMKGDEAPDELKGLFNRILLNKMAYEILLEEFVIFGNKVCSRMDELEKYAKKLRKSL